MAFSVQDEKFMQRALFLAEKGEGKVSPNPLVGCVIAKNGKILSEGFHSRVGALHAEADALAKAPCSAGATMYVSLEPCSDAYPGKKTPPCSPRIISAGIARVVIAAMDPQKKVRGVEMLRKAGIRVETGLLEKGAKEQNEAFFKFAKAGRPFVALKIAQSPNGVMGIRGRGGVRISGAAFDAHVQRLRNRYDAILVGINTVLADNPRLTCRMKWGRNPARIIVDGQLRVPLGARALANAEKEKVIIATTERRDLQKEALLRATGVRVAIMGESRVDLEKFLSMLPSMGIHSVLAEGGAEVAKELLGKNLADKIIVAVSGKRIPGKDAVKSPVKPAVLAKMPMKRMGADKVYSGYLTSYSK